MSDEEEIGKAVDEAFMEQLWGPAPSREEYLRVLEKNEDKLRERLISVLEGCYIADRAAELLNLPIQEVWRQIEQGEMIGLSFDAYRWVPKWQFVESEDGKLEVHPKVIEAKTVWGNLDEFGFCSMMLDESPGAGKTRVDVLMGQDEDAIREVMFMMHTHGINPM